MLISLEIAASRSFFLVLDRSADWLFLSGQLSMSGDPKKRAPVSHYTGLVLPKSRVICVTGQ